MIPRKTRKDPEIPESKKDTRKCPIVYFITLTWPKPDPLPGIFSNTRPDLTQYWKTLPVGHCSQETPLLLGDILHLVKFGVLWPRVIEHQRGFPFFHWQFSKLLEERQIFRSRYLGTVQILVDSSIKSVHLLHLGGDQKNWLLNDDGVALLNIATCDHSNLSTNIDNQWLSQSKAPDGAYLYWWKLFPHCPSSSPPLSRPPSPPIYSLFHRQIVFLWRRESQLNCFLVPRVLEIHDWSPYYNFSGLGTDIAIRDPLLLKAVQSHQLTTALILTPTSVQQDREQAGHSIEEIGRQDLNNNKNWTFRFSTITNFEQKQDLNRGWTKICAKQVQELNNTGFE